MQTHPASVLCSRLQRLKTSTMLIGFAVLTVRHGSPLLEPSENPTACLPPWPNLPVPHAEEVRLPAKYFGLCGHFLVTPPRPTSKRH